MKRELGSFERALVIANRYAPFHSVYVLRLGSPPPSQYVGRALRSLQKRHPFLQMRLLEEKGRYYFANLVEPPLIFHVLPRWNDSHWVKVTEIELETQFEHPDDPPFRCTYLYDENQKHAELILTFSRSFVDAASAACLMDELLLACASFMDVGTVTVSDLDLAPAQESRFPSEFRGFRLGLHQLGYMGRQFMDEIRHRIQSHGKRTPHLNKKPSHGHIISLCLPGTFVSTLLHRAELEKVTLNPILHAALLVAVNRHIYAGQSLPMRMFSFWDMRPYVEPPLPDENLGCYITALRHSLPVNGGVNVWQLAHTLQQKFYLSLKSGDHFVAALRMESLLKQMIGAKSFHMGMTALSFQGTSHIKTQYGDFTVDDLHGYISPHALGPQFCGQARFFNGQMTWDFTYLDADMTHDEARAIVEEIKSILNSAVTSPLFSI
jgi:hypothetical protein